MSNDAIENCGFKLSAMLHSFSRCLLVIKHKLVHVERITDIA